MIALRVPGTLLPVRSPLAWWTAARRPPALCFTCGADPTSSSPTCDHALTRSDRLRWRRAPWHDGLLDTAGDLVVALGLVLVLCGFGPCLWWLTYGWPPTGWIEVFGVLGVALVTLPGAVVSLGILISLPELRRGRRWDVVDTEPRTDDTILGTVWLRRGRPHAGGVSHHLTIPVAAPSHRDFTSETAAAMTDDPAEIVLGAVLGLAARGQLSFTRTLTTGFSILPPDAPRRIHDHGLTLATSAVPTDLPWLEQLLLNHATSHPTPCQRPIADFTRALAHEIGFQDPDDSGPLRWTESISPGVALRTAILDAPPSPDPTPLREALSAWRTLDPAGAEMVIDSFTRSITVEFTPAAADADLTPPPAD